MSSTAAPVSRPVLQGTSSHNVAQTAAQAKVMGTKVTGSKVKAVPAPPPPAPLPLGPPPSSTAFSSLKAAKTTPTAATTATAPSRAPPAPASNKRKVEARSPARTTPARGPAASNSSSHPASAPAKPVRARSSHTTTPSGPSSSTARSAAAAGSQSAQSAKKKGFSIDDFEIGRPLGRGKFGNVYLVRLKENKKILAMKVVFKEQIEEHDVKHQLVREINIHTRLRHKNIIRFYACFQTKERVHIVLEYANGGELYRVMQGLPGKRFPENRAAVYMKQLVSALQYCHSKGVIHRDIKPENLLLSIDKSDPANPREQIKLADFGWSVVERETADRSTMCGTLDYLPPEMVEGETYGNSVDIWTAGVLMYEFLVGRPPFVAPEGHPTATYRNIVKGKLQFPDHMSAEARDLITKLLRTNPHERLPLSQVCTHPWIVRHCGQPTAQELAEVASAVPSSRKRQRVRAAGATGAGGGAGCSSGGARAHAGSRHKPSIAPIAEGEEEA